MPSSVAAIRVVFLFEGLVVANWIPRIPDVKAAFGLSTGALGLTLAASSVGMICTLPVAGPLAARLSERTGTALGFLWLITTFLLLGFAWNAASLAVALFIFGTGIAPIETALNTSADRIELGAGRRIMSGCHGFWSLGTLVGAFSGTAASTLDIPRALHFAVLGPVVLAASALVSRWLPTQTPDRPPGPFVAWPTLGMLPLCLLPLASSILEGAMFDWAGLYMRLVHGAGPALTGAGFVTFTAGMAMVRFVGDPLGDRFGPVAVIRACGVAAITGLLVIGLAPNPYVAVAGFLAMAIGVSVVFPTAVTAAARRGDRPAGINVASLSLLGFTGFVSGPPLVGGLTQQFGMRGGLLCLLPFAVMVLVLAGQVAPRPAVAGPDP